MPYSLSYLADMPEYKMLKLPSHALLWYLGELKRLQEEYEGRITSIRDMSAHLQREVDRRRSAAAEIRRREEKDRKRQETLRLRNEELEMQHHRDTYAE